MGDRSAIEILHNAYTPKEGTETKSVSLYCHWSGERLLRDLKEAMATEIARARWDDPGYLTRIVFQIILEDAGLAETGYGIYPGSAEPMIEHPIITVDVGSQNVSFGDSLWSFEGFVSSDIHGYVSNAYDEDYNLRTYDEWLDWKDSLVVEKPLKTKLSDEKFEEALHTVALLDQEAKLRGWKSVVDAMNNL